MRVLKPGQEVTLHEDDDPTQTVRGYIRCFTVFDDGSVQYECRWWADGEPCVANFSLREIEEGSEAEYIQVSDAG